MSSTCLCGTHASQLPARSSAVKQVAERAGDRAVGTPAERCWGAACLPCRWGGGALQDIPFPPPIPGLLAFAETPPRWKEPPGTHGHPVTLLGSLPAGRPGSAPARWGTWMPLGLWFWGTRMETRPPPSVGLWRSRAFSPACREENGARRLFGFSLLGNITVLGSDGLLQSSGRCAFDLCAE